MSQIFHSLKVYVQSVAKIVTYFVEAFVKDERKDLFKLFEIDVIVWKQDMVS